MFEFVLLLGLLNGLFLLKKKCNGLLLFFLFWVVVDICIIDGVVCKVVVLKLKVGVVSVLIVEGCKLICFIGILVVVGDVLKLFELIM